MTQYCVLFELLMRSPAFTREVLMNIVKSSGTPRLPWRKLGAGAIRSLPPALLAVALGSVPAGSQVRVIVDGQLQEVPYGVVRTLVYSHGGPQTARDETVGGTNMPGIARVITTRTTGEDGDGNPAGTRFVTRIEPIPVGFDGRPVAQGTAQRPRLSQPYTDRDEGRAQGAQDTADTARSLRIPRDPRSGQFVARVRINGVPVLAIIDTGADSTVLSARDARATGAIRDVTHSEPMAGIGGVTMLDVTRVRSLNVGGQELSGFPATIGAEGIPYTLLGQTEIARLGRIVIDHGVMTISPSS